MLFCFMFCLGMWKLFFVRLILLVRLVLVRCIFRLLFIENMVFVLMVW